MAEQDAHAGRNRILNFILFQVIWFACVMGAAAGFGWQGALVAFALLPLNLRWVPSVRSEVRLWIGVAVIGSAVETLVLQTGAFGYVSKLALWPAALPPLWIVALWVAFASLLRLSLAWLAGKPRLAALLGAIGGPLSIASGARLGAVDIHDGWLAYSLIALEWAVLTPLLMSMAHPASQAPRA